MIGGLPDHVLQFLMSYLGADDLIVSCALLNKRFLNLTEDTAKLIISSIFSIRYPQWKGGGLDYTLSSRFSIFGPQNKTVSGYLRYLQHFCRPTIILAGCKSSEVNKNNKTFKIDIRSGGVSPCSDMSDLSPHSNHSIIAIPNSNTLVCITETDPPGESIIQFYDSLKNLWSTVPSIPVGLRFMTIAPFFSPTSKRHAMYSVDSSYVQENLLMIGGVHQDSLEFSEDVYFMSSTSTSTSAAASLQSLHAMEGVDQAAISEEPKVQWCVLPLLPSSDVMIPRFGHCALSLSTNRRGKMCNLGPQFTSYILAMGGKSEGTSLYTATTSLLSVQAQTNSDGMSVPQGCWSKGPPMTVSRVWFHSFFIADFIYAVGGDVSESGADLFPTIEKLAVPHGSCADHVILESSWQQVASFPRFRRNFTVSSYSNRLYIIGGRDEYYGPVQTIDVFNTETCMWEPEQSWGEFNFLELGGQAVSIPSTPYSWC